MCLHAAFRATHRRGRLRYIETLQGPEHEDLLLPPWKRLDGFLESIHGLRYLELMWRLRIEARRLSDRILLIVFVITPKGQPGDDSATDGAAPLHVPDPVFENPIEQRLPFFRRPLGIRTRKLQHRILHGIERIILMTQRGLGDLESLQFDAGQKLVQRTRLA